MFQTDDERIHNNENRESMEADFLDSQRLHEAEGHTEPVSGCLACQWEQDLEETRKDLDQEWDLLRATSEDGVGVIASGYPSLGRMRLIEPTDEDMFSDSQTGVDFEDESEPETFFFSAAELEQYAETLREIEISMNISRGEDFC